MKRFLFFLALLACGVLSYAYDFSAVAPTGQTLYYNISDNNATVTYPGYPDPWYGYTEPSGSLVIPSTVTYNSQTYSVTSIGEDAFYGCRGLTSVTIGSSVTSIGEGAFCDCRGLTSVTIPNSVTSIRRGAFYYCSGLTSVTIGNSVTSIGDDAFSGCRGLTSVTIPNSVTSIGDDAFYGVSVVSYCGEATGSPWGADQAGCFYEEGDFIYQDESKTVILAYIGSGNVVIIPNSVTSIGSRAFDHCTSLTSVTIPNSVTSIGNEAFRNCSGLTSVTIPNFVDTIHGGAFYQCNNLISVTFNADSCIVMGYYEDDMIVIEYPVFGDCINLTQLIIGPNVKIIPRNAFSGCSGLTSVTIGNSVTSIGDYAFSGCSGLTSVTIPNSVTSIGNRSFRNCSGLTSVTIGNSVTSIGSEAFYGCDHLSSITCKAVVPPTVIDVNAFEEVWKGLPLTVPNESVSQYQYAYGWREFTNIIGATMGIEEAKPEYEIVSTNGSIAISGAEGQMLRICDIQGRMIVSEKAGERKSYAMPSEGVYMVQVGNHKAQKVVVVK